MVIDSAPNKIEYGFYFIKAFKANIISASQLYI